MKEFIEFVIRGYVDLVSIMVTGVQGSKVFVLMLNFIYAMVIAL